MLHVNLLRKPVIRDLIDRLGRLSYQNQPVLSSGPKKKFTNSSAWERLRENPRLNMVNIHSSEGRVAVIGLGMSFTVQSTPYSGVQCLRHCRYLRGHCRQKPS